ncbi:MAG TPA: methyl-accepting chemotaxis protein [Polyangiaceae bacterium]
MTRHWTFGQKVGFGFGATVLLALMIGVVAIYALDRVIDSKDQVIDTNARRLIDLQKARYWFERKSAESRRFLLAGDPSDLDRMRSARTEFQSSLASLESATLSEEGRRLRAAVDRAEREHQDELDKVIELKRNNAAQDSVVSAFESRVRPKREEVDRLLAALSEREETLMQQAKAASSEAASTSISLMVGIAAGVVVLGALIAMFLTKMLSAQISDAIGFMQTSSVELEATANQQATGVKEQATAMNEITTTINELLTTSRQIATSAQRVVQIATQTASSANSGDSTVSQAHASISAIQRQVDLVVGHMLDLGKKSQQIGGVLDIVSELAEQTNILAINASIEAAGAGESGRRFGVVADEIRKLADRVTNATKEIRTLIEDVRGAVNTTVMATETGSKAVDAGTRQFNEVATSFKQITGMVGTTTEAAREIELSTKQQATAVEQVNLAISNVAQATRENQASSTQTLQAVAQLAKVSKDLSRLVQAQGSA